MDFGVGVVGLKRETGASVFVKPKFEVVHNSLARQNPINLRDRKTCQSISHNMGIFAGGSLALFGVSYSQEHQLWGRTENTRTGPDCSEFD